MTSKEKLYYLLEHVIIGEYDMLTFANIYTNIINLELNVSEFTVLELDVFTELNKYTSRFSPYVEDLKFNNVFYDEKILRQQINVAMKKLKLGTNEDGCK